MEKRCFGCMKIKTQSPLCEHCGYNENIDNLPHQLSIGTVLHGRYQVGKALGQGGFGITYIGWDMALDHPVAIKEYYPGNVVSRSSGTRNVTLVSNQAQDFFLHNRERFLQEARTLAKLKDINGIVHVVNLFSENQTAYIVMEYIQGIDLRRYIRMTGGRLTVEQTLGVLRPVMESLQKVHEAGLIHRDVTPDNIMIQRDGSVKLLDFGAVCDVSDSDGDIHHSTEAILKYGFAPIEQYQKKGSLGPWTDVYSLCATIYYCTTGKVPAEAPERMAEDIELDWSSVPGLTAQQAAALNKGMALRAKDRTASMKELQEELFRKTVVNPEPEKKKKKKEKEKGAGLFGFLHSKSDADTAKKQTKTEEKNRAGEKEQHSSVSRASQVSHVSVSRVEPSIPVPEELPPTLQPEELNPPTAEPEKRIPVLSESAVIEEPAAPAEHSVQEESAPFETAEAVSIQEAVLTEEAAAVQEAETEAPVEEEIIPAAVMEEPVQEEIFAEAESAPAEEPVAEVPVVEEIIPAAIVEEPAQEETPSEEAVPAEEPVTDVPVGEETIPAAEDRSPIREEVPAESVAAAIANAVPVTEVPDWLMDDEVIPEETAAEPEKPPVRTEQKAEKKKESRKKEEKKSAEKPQKKEKTPKPEKKTEPKPVKKPEPKPEKQAAAKSVTKQTEQKKSKLPIVILGIVLVIVLVLFLLMGRSGGETEPSTEVPAEETTQAVQVTETTVPEETTEPTVALAPWEKNVIMVDPSFSGEIDEYYGTGLMRRDIQSVTFLDTADIPANAADASENAAGTVWAWADGENVFIAADGGINGMNCKKLFFGLLNLEEVNFNGVFHTEHATSMNRMFYGCENLKSVDISTLVTSNVTDMDGMFYNCDRLKEVITGNFDVSSVETYEEFMTEGQKFCGMPWEEYLEQLKAAPAQAGSTLSAGDFTYSVTRFGDMIVLSGENLSIEVKGGKDVTVTLSGLTMQDSYMTNFSTTQENTAEYFWSVSIFGDTEYEVATFGWAFNPGEQQEKSIYEMENYLYVYRPEQKQYNIACPAEVSYTESSITWRFTMKDDYVIDFMAVDMLDVQIYNVADNVDILQTYRAK